MKNEMMSKEEARKKLGKYLDRSPLKVRPYMPPVRKPDTPKEKK